MGKFLIARCILPFLLFFSGSAVGAGHQTSDSAKSVNPGYGSLIRSQIQRMKDEVERTRGLVANGTLARVQLKEAEERLADAEDEGILADTLYSSVPVEKFTQEQASAMLGAAQRRVDRESAIVDSRQHLLDSGAISQSEFEISSAALDTRKQVLVLAQNRIKLLDDLRQMAETEKRAELAVNRPATLENSLRRYNGNGAFSLADVPVISSQFERRFHHALPVSALGQTLLHQSLGLDHRNRVDIALNPDSSEGIWLRNLLERLHIPYLAFSSAVAGAATAPHIHVGVESTRLKALNGGMH